MSQFIVLPDGGGAAAAVARSFYVQVDPQVLVRARIHGMDAESRLPAWDGSEKSNCSSIRMVDFARGRRRHAAKHGRWII